MVKIVPDKRHNLTIAIQENFSPGMKPKEIANLFKISKQRINYWIHYPIKKRIRRGKLIRKEINMLVKWAKDKPIMECKVLSKQIKKDLIDCQKSLKKKKQKKISLSTANRVLNRYIGEPKIIRKVFYLK